MQGRNENRYLAIGSLDPEGAHLQRLAILESGVIWWRNDNTGVVAKATGEPLDCREATRCRDSDDEVNPHLEEHVHDLEGRVAPVQNEDIAGLDAVKQPNELFALGGGIGRNRDVVGDLGNEIEERTGKNLWTVGTRRGSERVRQLVSTLNIDLRAVDSEHTPTMPPKTLSELLVEFIRCGVDQGTDELGGYLGPGLGERCCGDGLIRWQWDIEALSVIPEGVKQMSIAATIGVAYHVEEDRHDQVGSERAATGEIAARIAEFRSRGT
jgi:hypothetical protein